MTNTNPQASRSGSDKNPAGAGGSGTNPKGIQNKGDQSQQAGRQAGGSEQQFGAQGQRGTSNSDVMRCLDQIDENVRKCRTALDGSQSSGRAESRDSSSYSQSGSQDEDRDESNERGFAGR